MCMIDLPYRDNLSARDLVDHIRHLLAVERSVEQLLCRYLADLADRVEEASHALLGGYADIYHAARCLFRMSQRRTRERVRMGKALRELGRIEEAFVTGELAYSRVRELTRVATPASEESWLELGRRLPMRQLEQRVAEAGDSEGYRERAAERTREPASVSWTSHATVEVHVTMPAAEWALLQRAMEGARAAAEVDGSSSQNLLTDAEALGAVARDALAKQQSSEGVDDRADPRRNVVLYECASCRRTELDTGAGAVELEPAAAATLGCGARERDLLSEGKLVRRGGPVPAGVRRAVWLRDRCRCRVPGCTRRRYVDLHHIEPREDGGAHSRPNACLLCSTHHRRAHKGELRIDGDADGELRFFHRDGAEFGSPPAGDPIGSLDLPADLQSDPDVVRQILRAMGGRGPWHPDALHGRTGVPFPALTGALLELRLAGLVRCDLAGLYYLG
jgi:hypothetical protein